MNSSSLELCHSGVEYLGSNNKDLTDLVNYS
jgi:hypothetical protein